MFVHIRLLNVQAMEYLVQSLVSENKYYIFTEMKVSANSIIFCHFIGMCVLRPYHVCVGCVGRRASHGLHIGCAHRMWHAFKNLCWDLHWKPDYEHFQASRIKQRKTERHWKKNYGALKAIFRNYLECSVYIQRTSFEKDSSQPLLYILGQRSH